MIVLAPHPDDELLGCWPYLEDKKVKAVVYFFDYDQPALSATRRNEAERCAAYFGFQPIFAENFQLPDLCYSELVLVPSFQDSHPHHRLVHNLGRKLPNKMYYSVDLEYCRGKELVSNPEEKRAALDKFYPSQKSLWENNASYYLFNHTYKDGARQVYRTQVVIDNLVYNCVSDVDFHLPYIISGDCKFVANLLIDTAISAGANFVEVQQGNQIWREQ